MKMSAMCWRWSQKGSWLERPRHRDPTSWVGVISCQCPTLATLDKLGQPHSSFEVPVSLQEPWLGAGEGRELGGASFSIIHGEISADGAGAFRGWFLMEPADVSGQ